MAKDKTDNATQDILNPNRHGGFRRNAGRKKNNDRSKVKLGWYISVEAKQNLELLAADREYSASEFLDHIMRNTLEAPEKLNE
jgi:hypothetical protein